MWYFLTRIHNIKHVNPLSSCALLYYSPVQVETPSVIFGVPLSHMRRCGQMRQGLPLVLTEMVQFLDKHGECDSPPFSISPTCWGCVCNMCICLGLLINGLFGVDRKVKHYQELKKSFNNGGFPEFDFEDIHPLASLLKLFLKALPGGLVPEPHGKQLLKVFQGKWSLMVMNKHCVFLIHNETNRLYSKMQKRKNAIHQWGGSWTHYQRNI